jgi:hypothetical protein
MTVRITAGGYSVRVRVHCDTKGCPSVGETWAKQRPVPGSGDPMAIIDEPPPGWLMRPTLRSTDTPSTMDHLWCAHCVASMALLGSVLSGSDA